MSADIRFLNAFTFYPAFLDDFYRQNPGLIDAGHAAQVAGLVASGFAEGHMLTGELNALGWRATDVIANDPVSQSAWAHENGLADLAQSRDCAEITRRQVTALTPEIVYTNDVINLSSVFFRSLPSRPPLIAGWRGFPVPTGLDLSAFDVILTSFDRIVDEATKAGAKTVLRFAPGFPDRHPVVAEPRRLDWDVVFSGTVTRHHLKRIRTIEFLAEASRDGITGFRFGLFMPDVSALSPETQALNRGARWAHDMVRLLRSARIVVNIDVDAFGAQPPNMRLIEATGAGAFLLTPAHPELKNYFEPGVEVETFRTENELMAKIGYFLGDTAACDAIAAAGQARCLSDHALSRRAVQFKEMMERQLAAHAPGR